MKLYDVVFTKNKVTGDSTEGTLYGDLRFVESCSDKNKKYKNIYIENSITDQRYFLSKDLIRDVIKSRKEKDKLTYPDFITPKVEKLSFDQSDTIDYFVTTYDFGELKRNCDIRNYNIVIDKEGNSSDIISIAIDVSSYQLIDYEASSSIEQTGKRNDFQTCMLDGFYPETKEDEDDPVVYVIGLILRPINDYNTILRFNVMLTREGLSVYKYDLMYADPKAYVDYINLISENDKYYKSFKLTNIKGLNTEVVLVSEKYSKVEDGQVVVKALSGDIPGKESVKSVITCTNDMVSSNELDETLLELISHKNVRAITTIGVKLNKEFFRNYKILYLYNFNPKTGLSTCLKSN